MEKNQARLIEDAEENLKQLKGPILKTNIRKSNDGKWLIHETIVTDIKPVTHGRKTLSPHTTNPSTRRQSSSKLILITPLVPR